MTFNFFQLREKLEKCVKVVDEKRSEIPDLYISYLVAAEDYRSSFHYGIDQVGIFRALYKRVLSSEIQGASTIEQQFARVVIDDYAYSLQRKIKEQLLAILLANKRNKADIAKAYLAIAYYGHDCEGVKGIANIVGTNLMLASENQIISIVARLKYSKPYSNVAKWEVRFNQRISYIKKRHQKAANKSRQRMLGFPQFSGHASITPQEEKTDAENDHGEENPTVRH
ncbi:transglycosylase domain-containing protein [Marinobacter piscensis]|uniref:transglycosylase domain-containing protein n=1 Tax=Marinobacter piscensis TaxID=1562308 RepID=UPI0016425F36|nr:transglycosylase domain-containing protein [Marinobacter piscensis]